jgi:hypothetical protein
LDYQYAAYAWVVYDAGLAETDKSPSDLGIPRLEEWDWNKEKAKYGYK